MSLTLDGSNGIILPVGNLTSPSLGSAGAGMYVPAANTLAFVTNSLNRITIDSSGTVSLANNVVVSGTLTFGGTTISANTNLVTLTDSQTLTNKTLTSPTINGGSALDLAQLTVDGNTTLGDAAGDTLTINAGTTTFTQGTANGVLYLNGSKVATSGGALTFDGGNLRVNGTYALNQTNLFEISNGQSGATKFATGLSLISDSDGYESALYVSSGSDTRWNLITGTPTTVLLYSANTERARITSKGLLVDYTSDSGLSGTGNAIFSGNVGIGTASPYSDSGFKSVDIRGSTGAQLQLGTTSGREAELSGTATGGLTLNTINVTPIRFFINGGERMRLDSSGNLGLGVTPSAWGGSYRAHQIGKSAAVWGSPAADIGWFSVNTYFDNTNYRYVSSDKASYYLQYQGAHVWTTAPSGTAGNAITFTQAMTLTASGNLFIGATSGINSANFQISTGSGASTAPYSAIFNTATSPTAAASTRFDLGFLSGASNYVATGTVLGATNFMGQANDDGYTGAFINAKVISGGDVGRAAGHSVDLIFGTKSSIFPSAEERMRIDSSGNLGLGVTPDNSYNACLQLKSGITFPATQVASANANTLDDYEEGSWTPVVGGTATYFSQAGTYVKIGRFVYVDFLLRINTIGTGSSTIMTGLPFVAGSGNTPRSSGSIAYAAALASSVYSLSINVDGNGIQFEAFTSLATGTVDNIAVWGNGAYIIGSATYYTSA